MGGAIYYNLYRPTIAQNVFTINSAPYGNHIASYPVKIVNKYTLSNIDHLNDAASGLSIDSTLEYILIDFDGQVVNFENQHILKITPEITSARVKGTDFAKFNDGGATFNNLVLAKSPGSSEITFLLSTKAIDKTQVIKGLNLTEAQYNTDYKSTIDVSFRF